MTRNFASTHAALWSILVAVLAMLLPAVATAQDATPGDEITIVGSDPRANAVLADAPDTVTITFSAGIDSESSTVRVIGSDGQDIDGMALTWPAADTATVTLPVDVPHGTWLLAWDVTAPRDDTTGAGFYGFTVGTDQDVAPLTIPDTGFAASGVSRWIAAAAQGAVVLGLAMLIAVWPLRSLALRASKTDEATLSVHIHRLVLAGAAIAGIGALARIGTLTWTDGDESWLEGLLNTLRDTDTGGPLLMTLALVSLHMLVLALPSGRWAGFLPWLTTLALPVPLVLLSHAPDEPASRLPAMTVTWLALVALALLAGGAIVLPAARVGTDRFGLVTAIALPVLTLGGGYLLWLYTGNRTALEDTSYGRIAAVTVVIAGLFALALVGAQLLGRHIRSTRVLLVPAALGITLALGGGALMTIDTARAELTRDASQRVVPLTLDGDRAQLILAPGAAGVNHVRLELDRSSVSRQATATLTMSLPSRPELGNETVTLARVGGNAFEYHGSELAVADQWSLDVRLAEPGSEPARDTAKLDLEREATTVDVPGVPWRFTDFAGSAGVVMIVIGIAGVAIGLASGRSPLRLESGGLGVAALVLAAILLGQGRLDPILALGGGKDGGAINLDDLAMITRGEEVYADYCMSCHGAELRGDGPAADGMQPPPADFAAPHTMVHDEATLIYWVRNGKQGTAMPAFGDRLTDQQIANVLSYIEREQRAFASGGTVPDPALCTAAPRSEDELAGLTALTIQHGPSGELEPADNPNATSATVDAVTGTVTETIACLNAGDVFRATSLLTDDAVAWAFTAGHEPFGTPASLPVDDRIAVESIGNVTVLADDRVAVVATIRDAEDIMEPLVPLFDASDDPQQVTFVLIRTDDGDWLIDEVRS